MTPAARLLVTAGAACAALAGGAPAEASGRPAPSRCLDLFHRDAPPIPIGSRPPSFLAVADFDGDGRDDLAYDSDLAPEANLVTVLLSRRDGTVSARVTPIRFRAPKLVTGDLDLDGHQDLVTSGLGTGEVSVLLGDGTGRFVERPGPQLSQSAMVRAIAPFDGDAHPDVLVAAAGPPAPALSVLRGDGAGGLTATAASLPVPGMRGGLAVRDLDGDGRNDVVLDTTSAGSLSVAFGDGAAGFRSLAPAAAWNFASWGLAVADFDRDGRVDVGIDPIGGTMAFAGDGAGRFTPFPASPGIPVIGFGGAVSADFDGDGNPDLADTTLSSSGEIYVWLGDGRGRFAAADGSPEWGGRYPAVSALIGDFNGDGRPDLAGVSGWQRLVRVHLNTSGRRNRPVQAIRFARAVPHVVSRGAPVDLSASLRCRPGLLELYRRPLRRPSGGRWTRVARVETDHRGIAALETRPRASAEYQWRLAAASGRIARRSRRRAIVVTSAARLGP